MNDAIYTTGKNSPSKWWHVSWRRAGKIVLITFAALLLVDGLVSAAFYQLAPWLTARHVYREMNMNQIPTSLSDQKVTPLSGSRIENYGFSIQVPWNEPAFERKQRGVFVVAYLSHGAGIMIVDPSGPIDSAKAIRMIAVANKLPEVGKSISNYDLMAESMAATPDQVKWWRPPLQNARSLTLLEMKGIALRDFHALYQLNFGEWRGFQEGNPARAPFRVQLELFDGADQHLGILISGKSGSGPVISQAEINAMVASIKRVSVN
jgi:hypothetical protein